jgi:heme A synthase
VHSTTAGAARTTSRAIEGVVLCAWAVLAYNIVVIAWGAFVRATGSGAGCGSHWPLCNGVVIPRTHAMETVIELTHRATSGLALVAVFALAVWVFRTRPAGHAARRPAAWSAALIVVEALLGASLVLFGWVEDDASWGRIVALGLHLANTFLLLAALTLTAWRVSGAPGNTWRGHGVEGGIVWAALVLTMAVGVTGAITALGDTLFPAESLREGIRQDFAAAAHLLVRLRVIHPVLALITALTVVVGAGLLARRRRSAATSWCARAARTLVLAQVIGGFVNLALLAPTWMQLVHLVLADLPWVSLILLGAAALAADARQAPLLVYSEPSTAAP